MTYYLNWNNVYLVPVLHYTMESAAYVKWAFDELQPYCVAVELAETMESALIDAAARLPDISVVMTDEEKPLYYLVEPCDASFEALRIALENKKACYCIDLDVNQSPSLGLLAPDPYVIARLGLKVYYEAYSIFVDQLPIDPINQKREEHMARRLKELSLSHEKVLFVGGMDHIGRLMKLLDQDQYPIHQHRKHGHARLCTLTEESCRQVMAESAYMSIYYNIWRTKKRPMLIDRNKLNYIMMKESAGIYTQKTGNRFENYHLKNTLKFARNWSLIRKRLLPELYQLLIAARGCVDSNYAYELWELATYYMHLHNVDGLLPLDLTPEDIWGHSAHIKFRLMEKGRKDLSFKKRKNLHSLEHRPFNPFSLCSYPKEDVRIEGFASHLKKRGELFLQEEASRTMPFSTSLEEGIDTKETIRHWTEKKIYVKQKSKPQGSAGSVVIIFDEDELISDKYSERHPWKLTWQGENTQESDMAFYATDRFEKMVGPGIGRCEYGGLMMSFPPGRMFDIWHDPDYANCKSKAEVLLMAAIDYAQEPLVIYVANRPPRSYYKQFASRFGKKVVYLPLSQFSSPLLNQLRVFHVLDGHDRRKIADDYIF